MYVGKGCSVVREPGDIRQLRVLYGEAVDRAVRAEDDGYDFVTVHEHHFEPDQWSSPLMILASIAARTSSIQMGTAVLLGALYNPLRLAEDIATLDVLSGGRLSILALGTGSASHEFDTYGVASRERFGRVFELAGFLRKFFASEPFDHDGKYFKFSNVRSTTKPVQDPFPIWVAAIGPKMMRRVGREGYNLINTLETHWYFDEYLAGLREAGRDPDDVSIAISGVGAIVVSTSREAARLRATIKRIARASTVKYLKERDVANESINPIDEWQRRGEAPGRYRGGIVGTPDQVLAELEPLLKDSRVTHLKAGSAIRTIGSENLWLDEVVPVLRTWGRTPREPSHSVQPASVVTVQDRRE